MDNSTKEKLNKKLLKASFDCNWNQTMSLIKRGANINILDKNGSSPLMMWSGEKSCFSKYLVDLGAQIDFQNNHGNTALHSSCQKNNIKTVLMLLKLGSNPTLKNKDKKYAFDFLNQKLRDNFIEELILIYGEEIRSKAFVFQTLGFTDLNHAIIEAVGHAIAEQKLLNQDSITP